ncbi:uncharacterized protein pcare2 [Alosa pseudoharengus]|uniref:uncharacterized protein pcare2 n=1 Tax=Alosa pseudoharengus TaxID=34774 RepID=UPI003F8C9CC9
MGCSPSKGKLFTGAFSPKQKALPAPPEKANESATIAEISNQCVMDKSAADCGSGKDEQEEPIVSQEKRSSLAEVVFDTTSVIEDGIQKKDANIVAQEELSQVEEQPQGKPPREKGERRKKSKGGKKVRPKDKIKKNSIIQAKIELPEDMVKAHQAAYAYLNPNISKYETLLGLLDQAAQTQHSLQSMVTMVAMRYDEINQTLEEMAKEGERMLKEHGDHMAWPAALMNTPLVPGVKPSVEDQGCPGPPPPDLLQQLLQHSTEKMRQVGESVTGLGDSALEEATEYFASLSGLLGEKLMAKRDAECRLKQVLTCVEAAAVRKLGLEDSALHSEDSGIGGENESLPGSERHRKHRESCASSTVAHGILLPHGEDEEEDEEEEEDDEDDDEDVEDEETAKEHTDTVVRTDRRSSNSSLLAHNQKANLNAPKQNPTKEQKQTTRPKTADNTKPRHRRGQLRGPRRSCSLDNLYQNSSLAEPNVNQKGFIQRQERIGRGMEGVRGAAGVSSLKAKLRRHSSGGQSIERGPIRAGGPSTALPMLAPVPPGRNAVKRLITTFSHGVNDKPSVPPHVKINRKCHFPMISNAQTSFDGPSNKNNGVHHRHPDRHDDLDVDSLPPPPPEVLMDNSFEVTKGLLGQTAGQKTSVSQKLRASVQSMTVLPNRGSIHQGSLSLSPACHNKTDAVEDQLEDPDEEAETLYRQARKIIHLRDAACSPANRCKDGMWSTSGAPAGLGSRQGSSDYGGDGDTLSPQLNTCPPTTPPVSRTRLPPSCPSVCRTFPAPSSCPSEGQWRAPSPPASNTPRWTRGNSNSDENIPVLTAVAFASARSVFCQDQTTRTPSCTSTLPRPWGETSRGRLPINHGGLQGFARRSSSEQRAPSSRQTEQTPTSEDPAESSATKEK